MNPTFTSFLADARRAIKWHNRAPRARPVPEDTWRGAVRGIGTVVVFALLCTAVGWLMAAVVVFIF